MIQQEINLNLIPSSEPVVVHCNQYDEGKSRIIAHLYNGSHPYTPGANATVKVQGTKPDNHAYQYWCEISGSTVTIDVNQQMTAVAGRVPSQLIVNETTGLTGSFAFYLDVQESTLPSNIDISETDIPILTEEAQEAAQRAIMAAASAQDSADDAAAWSSNPPYIGLNKNWYVYDITTEQFVDSGICAEGIGIDNIAKTATVGLIDTYTITYTDGTTQDYYVTNGADGNKWYKGTAISGGSSTPTVFPSSGITKANHNDFYLNTTEGAIYHCETGGDASTATWAYDFTLTGGGSGGVTNYNDLSNRPQINGVILSGNKSTSDLGINSGNVILSSIMHIGGQTQTTTQEALEALNNKDSGGSFIKVTTPDASLYGDTLTLSDGTTTLTTVFDSSGNAEFNGVMMTGTLTLATGSITRQIEVPYFGNYAVTISLWSATIAITTDSVDLYGETVTVKDSLNQTVGTATISAQGTASVQVSATGTYTVYCSTLSPEAVVVSAQTTYFVTFHLWTATLSISTTSTALYGKSITVKKGSTTVGTTAFSAQGTASFRVHETGTYTAECEGYSSGDIVVSSETTYNAVITAGLDLAAWISAGSTTEHPLNPSSYADFAALESDEEAIRQLMTVHNAVDYLAQATAGDSLMESVIGSDVCAKWINLRDYALDTLYANSDIASEMDTADKYFYGEWVENSGTWGAKGNVPFMTADNAPYGNAIASSYGTNNQAFRAFDDSGTFTYWQPTTVSGAYIGYKFIAPICPKRVKYNVTNQSAGAPYVKSIECIVKGLNNGSWEEIDRFTTVAGSITPEYYDLECNKFYESVAVFPQGANYDNGIIITSLQFYGRELKPLVPVMTDNTHPKGEAINLVNPNTSPYEAYKVFDGNTSTRWSGASAPTDIGYGSSKKMLVKMASWLPDDTYSGKQAKLQVSDDKTTWDDITELFSFVATANNTTIKVFDLLSMTGHNYWRIYFPSTNMSLYTLQFYGFDYSEKEFAQDSNRLTIYDHGLSFVTFDEYLDSGSITYEPDQIYVVNLATNHSTKITTLVDYGTNKYSMQGMTLGNKMIGVGDANAVYNTSMSSAIATAVLNTKYTNALDVSGISGENRATGITLYGGEGTFTIAEWWLE